MKLIIKKISIEGFKGYVKRATYDLGMNTIISADNGKGKSSIGEAIVWAITGCDMFGNEKAATRLVNNNKPKVTEVCLWINLDEEDHVIIRRKKGSNNDVYFDERKTDTNELSKEIFKNKNIFLSIFNPDYFPRLTPKDAKQLLTDVLKPIGRDDIFAELGEYLVSILDKHGFMLPDTFISDCRGDIKEQEENILFLEGKKSSLSIQPLEDKKVFDSAELDRLNQELEKVNKSVDFSTELSSLVPPKDVQEEIDLIKKPVLKTDDIDHLEEIKRQTENAEIPLKVLIDCTELKYKRDDLAKRWKSNKSKLESVTDNFVECTQCGNKININESTKDFIKREMSEIEAEGKKVANEIKSVEAQNEAIKAENIKITNNFKEKQQTDIKDLDNKILELRQYNDNVLGEYEYKCKLVRDQYQADCSKYKADRQAILDKQAQAERELQEKINPLKAAINEQLSIKADIEKFNANIDLISQQNEDIEKQKENCDKEISISKSKIESLKSAIDACKQYNSIKLKKQSEQIKPYLDKVTISFEKLTKDGELKDDFKISYDNKEFNKLSNAEKIKAGLEVSNLLANVCHMFIPVFVDNAESINEIPAMDVQLLQAKVSKDNEVKVEIIK